MTYKTLITKEPKYLHESLQLVNQQSQRNTHVRDTYKLLEPRFNYEIGKHSYKSAAPRLFNKLTTEVKNCTSLESFKKKLKTYLFDKAYDIENKEMKIEYKV